MLELIPVEYANQRILTTQQLADGYETESKIISNNFNRNKERYIIGKHYFCLEGEQKLAFLNLHQFDDGSKNAKTLYLWTEKGALLHAKSLNTDKAWEVYEQLVENYFIAIEERHGSQMIDVSSLSPDLQMFKKIFDTVAANQLEQKRIQQQLEKTTEKVAAVENTLTIVKDTIIHRDDDWRRWLNTMFNNAVIASKTKDYQAFRTETYTLLEQRARCNLGIRLQNLRKRLEESGATKTKIRETGKLDVIEADPHLKEIYTAIIKELAIRYTA